MTPVSWAGSGGLAPSWRAGTIGCGPFWGYLNISYTAHYRNCCPGPGKRRMSVETGLGQGRFALQGTERLLQVLQRPEAPSCPGYRTSVEVFHQVTDDVEERAGQAKKSPMDHTLVSCVGTTGPSLNFASILSH